MAEPPAPVAEKTEEKLAEVAPEPVAAAPVAPRWIAEECGLEPNETNVILEEEMRKAYAVLRAATSEPDFSATAVAVETAVSAEAPAAEEAEAVVVESKPELVVEARSEPERVPVAEVTAEPASEPTPEPVTSVAEAVVEPEPVVAAVAEVTVQPEAAVAAAASAGAATEAAAVEAPQAPAPVAVEPEASPAKKDDTELAAAWAQWKEIRESVVGSGIAAQITEVAAQLTQTQAETPTEAKSDAEPAPAGNPPNIANIVDSVLAELKPKLVEEIARKLGKDKK